ALRPALVEALRRFLATRTTDAPAFRIPRARRVAAAMFRADVEAASIEYRDDSGLVADFHALRHTFITNLANSGVHPKTAQTLARHGTIPLTMDRYSHTLREQEAEALAVLPDLSGPSREALRATGTTDAGPVDACATGQKNDLALRLSFSSGSQ